MESSKNSPSGALTPEIIQDCISNRRAMAELFDSCKKNNHCFLKIVSFVTGMSAATQEAFHETLSKVFLE